MQKILSSYPPYLKLHTFCTVFNNYSCMALAIPILALLLDRFIKVLNYCPFSWECSMFLSQEWLLLLCCTVALRTYFLFSSVPVLGCVGVIRGLMVCLGFLAREGFYLSDWTPPGGSSRLLRRHNFWFWSSSTIKAPVSCLQRPSGQTLTRLEQDRIVWNETTKTMGRSC